jgi:hypothetical protein
LPASGWRVHCWAKTKAVAAATSGLALGMDLLLLLLLIVLLEVVAKANSNTTVTIVKANNSSKLDKLLVAVVVVPHGAAALILLQFGWRNSSSHLPNQHHKGNSSNLSRAAAVKDTVDRG